MEQYDLILKVMDGLFCICRLGPWEMIPEWLTKGTFYSIAKTDEELSFVCSENAVPGAVRSQMISERGWKCLKVEGPLDLSLTGILARLSSALAETQISIFVISTYDTDYILVKEEKLENAIIALISHGCIVR